MTLHPCLLIPIYNHGERIGDTVRSLLGHGLPIIIVDDGSDESTQRALAGAALASPLVTLHRLAVNSGKGAAVMHGMRLALAAGYTHALQIDADGQHDAADVPRFLAQGRAHPLAAVCGKPVYDATVPRGRLYGRYITHFWVWVETLSFAIADSMCGLRLYPLASTCRLLDEARIPLRMDFDTAIIVRLHWRGVPVINLDTRVTYPAGGLSNFHMWKDNLRISWMHTRLVAGMLARLPLLLARKLSPPACGGTHWSRIAERGSGMGLAFLFACQRLLGRRVVGLMLYPVAGYFLLAASNARRASRDYLATMAAFQGRQHKPGWRDTYRHMLAFARSSADKLAAWSGNLDETPVSFPDGAAFNAVLASGRGALLIGAHLGNLEMTRALAQQGGLATVNAVVYTSHAERFNRMLARANAGFGVNLLQVSSLGPDTAIMLRDKIDRGELLVIVGDRTPPGDPGRNPRTSTAQFLGRPASFPEGPFILAALLDCPVYLFFCLPEGSGYRLHFELFSPGISLPRRERQQRLGALVQQYATRLEAQCLKAPLQWFNFFDFWAAPRAAAPSSR